MFIQSDYIDDRKSLSEQELWTALSEDNRKALSELYLRFYEQLFRYGMSFFSNEEIVKDSIQKLFFRLWKKRKKLDTPRSIQGYLYVSLRRILLRIKERETVRSKRNAKYLDQGSDSIFSVEEQIILREEKKEREEFYRHALQSLTTRQKEALTLRIDSGMSNREIARIMEISDKRVRNLIYEATKRLRKKLKNKQT